MKGGVKKFMEKKINEFRGEVDKTLGTFDSKIDNEIRMIM